MGSSSNRGDCALSRGALPEDCAALKGWKTSVPLLVMGSQTWNMPNDKGKLFCDGDRQEQVFAAAARSVCMFSHACMRSFPYILGPEVSSLGGTLIFGCQLGNHAKAKHELLLDTKIYSKNKIWGQQMSWQIVCTHHFPSYQEIL